MNNITLSLNPEERAFLIRLLEKTLTDSRVEEHRTRTPSYRELVLQDEKLMNAVLQKLGHTPA